MKLPSLGDSISDATIIKMHKKVGQFVNVDEVICEVETDKVNVEIKSIGSGVITNLFASEKQKIDVGANFMEFDTELKAKNTEQDDKSKVKSQETPKEEPKVAAAAGVAPTEKKSEPIKQVEPVIQTKTSPNIQPQAPAQAQTPPQTHHQPLNSRNIRREPMSRMRQRIGERLKASQNTNATLTTFNEVDMSEVMAMRNKFQEEFAKKYGIKMGFMSFFLKASTMALLEMPIVNSVIEGTDIIHRDYVDISVAVATPNGLMVPVVRNCENKSLADFEIALRDLSVLAKDNKIKIEDIVGGNFSISNGGVYGSMMGTPIINPPQTAILGMHNITNRAVVRGDDIVARPMMYLALSYDHRLIDGREGVLFLKKIRDLIEEPRKMLLNI